MKTPIATSLTTLLTAAAVLAGLAARADASDTVSKSFTVEPGGQLVLNTDRGSIQVKGGDGHEVKVEVTRTASVWGQSRAEDLIKNHEVTFAQEGNTVTVKGVTARSSVRSWLGGDPIKVEYKVSVPAKFNVDLQTAGGSVRVDRLTGKVAGRTSGGSLHFEDIDGSVEGKTSGGSIKAVACKGPVNVNTSGGSISLEKVQGDAVAKTSGGSIRVQDLAGQCQVSTSGGGIDVSGVTGKVDASTSGGSVRAVFAQAPSGDCRLRTSGGGITVSLPEKAAVDVDARTSGGRVSSDLPVTTIVQGEQKKNHLQGKINGGGPLIVASTSGGSVHLRRND